jgi:hypothetical protein
LIDVGQSVIAVVAKSLLAGHTPQLYFNDQNSRCIHSLGRMNDISDRYSSIYVLQDHFRTLLADRDRRRVGVAGIHRRHDRGVDHVQALKTAHAQPFVNPALGFWPLRPSPRRQDRCSITAAPRAGSRTAATSIGRTA